MQPYAYRPLSPAHNSVRLIQILPGEPTSEIRCRLIDYALRNDQHSGLFEALSYVWGDKTPKHNIYIEQQVRNETNDELQYMEVTENLFIALNRLRMSPCRV